MNQQNPRAETLGVRCAGYSDFHESATQVSYTVLSKAPCVGTEPEREELVSDDHGWCRMHNGQDPV